MSEATAAPAASPAAPVDAAAPAAAAPPVEAATPPVAPVETEAKPNTPPVESNSKKAAKLAAKEAEIRERHAALQAQQKEIEDIRKKFEADQAELSRLRAIKNNPVALARELGMTPQQFLEAAAKGEGFNTDPQTAQQLAELKAKAEELEKKAEEQRKRDEEYRQQQVVAAYHGRIEAVLDKGGDRWAFAKAEGVSPQYILDAAKEHVRVHGLRPATASDENRIFETVLDNLETHLENKFQKVTAVPKWAQKFGKKSEAPAPAPAAAPTKAAPPPTLSNGLASAPAPDPNKAKRAWSRDSDIAFVKEKHATYLAQLNSKKPETKAPEKKP